MNLIMDNMGIVIFFWIVGASAVALTIASAGTR